MFPLKEGGWIKRIMKRISFCPLCESCCPVEFIFEGTKLAGVREADLLLKGPLCFKGKQLVDIINSPKRLDKPLKRIGPRGSDRWQEITWQEALKLIADNLFSLRQQYGPWSVSWDQGYGAASPYLVRFLNLFGTPNLVSRSHVCSQPRKIAQTVTFGGLAVPDVENSKLIVVWGRNKLFTSPVASHILTKAIRRGASLIVIDPRRTPLAGMSDLWLSLRPGTDGALALGILHVIINEELYDKDFVQHQCSGFPELVEAVSSFSPQRTAQITGIPLEDIITAAKMFALKGPSSIEMGNGLDQHTNSFQSIRAILSLMAVTGNLNVRGGNVLIPPMSLGNVSLPEALSSQAILRRIGSREYPLLSSYRHTVAAPKFIRALLDNHPEKPRALIVTKGNPIVTLAQSDLVQKALEQMKFIAVSDYVITETARLADLVLPAAFSCEGWELITFDPARNDSYYASMPQGLLLNRPLQGLRNTRTDIELIFSLAEAMGLKNDFWDGDIQASLNDRLRALDLKIDDFGEEGVIKFPLPEVFKGYNTPSGKVEFYSAILQKEGYSTVPNYIEPQESPESRPDLLSEYPLVISSCKSRYFVHSAYRWVDKLYQKEPDPLVEIHPETAILYGIEDGQWVELNSPRGSCRMRARLTASVKPGIICGIHGWSGEANINNLTSNDQCDPVLSSNPLKSLLCNIKPFHLNGRCRI